MFVTVPVYFPLPSVDLSPGIQRDFWVSDSNKAIGTCNSSSGKHWTQVLCFLVKGCTLDCRLVASYHSWSVGDLLIHQLCLLELEFGFSLNSLWTCCSSILNVALKNVWVRYQSEALQTLLINSQDPWVRHNPQTLIDKLSPTSFIFAVLL